MPPGNTQEKSPEGVYAYRMLFRQILDGVQKHLPIEGDLDHVKDTAQRGIEIMEIWRSNLPSWLAWGDEQLPSTDPLMAQLRAEFYGSMAEFLRPYLDVALRKCLALETDKLSAGHQALTDVVRLWVKAVSAYEAYQESSKSPVLRSNPVQTLHS